MNNKDNINLRCLEYYLNYENSVAIYSVFNGNIASSERIIKLLSKSYKILSEHNCDLDFNDFIKILIDFATYIKNLLQNGGVYFLDGENITQESGDQEVFENIFKDTKFKLTYLDISNEINRLKQEDGLHIPANLSAIKFMQDYLDLFGQVQNHLTKILLVPTDLHMHIYLASNGISAFDSTDKELEDHLKDIKRMFDSQSTYLFNKYNINIEPLIRAELTITKELLITILGFFQSKRINEQ